MHLLFASNDAYIPHVATTLASIFENNKDIEFVVHILVTDISGKNNAKLKGFVERYGHTLDIKVVNPNDLDIDLSVCGKWGIFPSLKLYAADLYPDVDNILYVDADMICLGSLKYIEQLDMSDYWIAMATDEQGAEEHKKRLGLIHNDFYGCAGLVWFNLDNWRKSKVRQKCFAFFNDPANREVIEFGEQDVMNKVCQGHIYELPIIYNMFSYYWLHHGRNIPIRYRKDIEEYKTNAVIIHYIDSCKPWFKDCLFPLKKYYWKYHSLTPWTDERYGYSKGYQGAFNLLKSRLKQFLNSCGLKHYEYAFDC